ncbi:MAG: DNA polymerase III subunit alpha [Bacteroidales bacterium]|nr:DNA polymerase III subunit alpha [Bacteroidales bacterium]
MPDFTHLHVHTQYSILDGAANISQLIGRARELGMQSLAITDHGNMFGVLSFFNEARRQGIKPLIGCEVYVAEGSRFEKRGKMDRSGHHLILIARNMTGYRNLSRLSSLGFLEGFYYTPRIDKELLAVYSEGLICSTACLGGEIPSLILGKGEEAAQSALGWYMDVFGGDFYLEMQDHGLPEQKIVNQTIVRLGRKNNIPVIASNDVHFIHAEDHEAHQILICLNTGKDITDDTALQYTGQEYLKSPEEMSRLFAEIPEAISNTLEVAAKVEDFDLHQEVILPRFPLPEGFGSESEYLRHLAFEGAKRKYGSITDELSERINFELKVIDNMDFPGYFLIVQDFVNKAREMGVMVGPGRGSAAGSAVAYCTGITHIDPIKYQLLFERFLNPDRVSMPDIDIDFDDEGREKVLDYVVRKYGEKRVAQIITFGTMAARLAIRDVARVLKLPLPEADRIAKLVPEKPGVSLKKAIEEVPELAEIHCGKDENARKTLTLAQTLEGSARHTGTHACGVIIGPDDLINYLPLSTAKDSKLMVTQYEGKLVESVGMLKMDLLGLKTLSIIKDAELSIEKRHGVRIDMDSIPLDDAQTFELYQKGETIGTFQFESEGMRTYLKELKPTSIEDLIAMNALYRPGPMDFIPTYIRRKHGKEKVEYPHPLLEGILKSTFGIMVYQEQIMQAAQIMGGFTLGKADLLRRAMGKKKMEIMEEQKALFVEGAKEKGIDPARAAEVFATMQEFAKYGFNRSHSAAYSVIAYQTAYLKAHYPPEYMAAVLTHNLHDIKKITFFIDECRRQGIEVMGPDVNESDLNFTVNQKGMIRFGLAAVKNVGESAARSIIGERESGGLYRHIFDFSKRISLKAVNRRCMEALAMAGAFDCFENTHRAQYFFREHTDDTIFLEKIIRHAASIQEKKNAAQASLFGDMSNVEIKDPEMPGCTPWTRLELLKNEKEVTGFYMSGHPLEDYKLEMDHFCNATISNISNNPELFKNKNVAFAGILTSVSHKTSRNGTPYASFSVEDYTDTIQLFLYSEDYLKMRHLLVEGQSLFIRARVQSRNVSSSFLEVRVSQMLLLPDVLERLTENITIQVNLEQIHSGMIDLFCQITHDHPGEARFRFEISDPETSPGISLPSHNRKVNPRLFLEAVKKTGLRFKLS